jgi:hypothetical protein
MKAAIHSNLAVFGLEWEVHVRPDKDQHRRSGLNLATINSRPLRKGNDAKG